MRILHVVATLNRGGIEPWLVQLLAQVEPLADIEMDFLVATTTSSAYDEQVKSLGALDYSLFTQLRAVAIRAEFSQCSAKNTDLYGILPFTRRLLQRVCAASSLVCTASPCGSHTATRAC